MSTCINNCLKYWRTKQGLTLTGLAEKVGTSRQVIHGFEKGNYSPSLETCLKISKALLVPVEMIWELRREQ